MMYLYGVSIFFCSDIFSSLVLLNSCCLNESVLCSVGPQSQDILLE